jgi:glycogen debranching enzyme
MSAASTEHTPPRQPLLNDATVALRAPTQVWSRATGDIDDGAIDGVYYADTRFFRGVVLTCDGSVPEWISVSEQGASRVVFGGLLRDLDDPLPDPRVRILRERDVTVTGLTESITIRSHVTHAIDTRVEVRLVPEFAGLTEVKAGLVGRTPDGIVRSEDAATGAIRWVADGRIATLSAPGARHRAGPDAESLVSWDLHVPPGGSSTVTFTLDLVDPSAVVRGAARPTGWQAPARVDDSRVSAWAARALDDLDALRLTLPEHPDDEFFAAGAPWFFTLFGRDSIWAARLLLPIDWRIAASTLRVLARLQGTESDVESAQQPGKILHELRGGPLEMPGEGLVLPPVYYGTVDATALWVCLLVDAHAAGMPTDEVRALLPTLRGCLEWMLHHGDADGDGFLDYRDETGHGLANQGWKDSGDSIQWRDGTLAQGPIALCEVQGYAYEAAVSGARLLDALGESGGDELRAWAAELKARFAEAYWVETPEGRYPAIALDAHKQPVDSLTSNIGHLLGTGILDPAEERAIAELLTGESMLSGYGIRTLSTAAAGYWPLSYHGGSVWTHDTAITLRGMAQAGLWDAAHSVALDLLAAAEGFTFRVPELHSGDPATETARPTPYPAACRPQAWSAASAITVADVWGRVSGARGVTKLV